VSGAQPKLAYDYYDEGHEEDAGNNSYDYETPAAENQGEKEVEEKPEKPEKPVDEKKTEKETPKRSRRQTPPSPGEYVYDEGSNLNWM